VIDYIAQLLHKSGTATTKMGSSSSKVARTAASTARRQYPSTSSIPTNSAPTSNPRTTNAPPSSTPTAAQVHPDPSQAPPSSTKSQHIDLDGRDPQFGSRLAQIGPVQPVSQSPSNQHQFPPSASPSRQGRSIFPSTSAATNPAVLVVEARERINKLWEAENESVGRGSFQGRTMISAAQIRDVLSMKESGMESGEIERRMRLRAGLVKRLGVGSVVANA
jgi:hypothetical protein